MKYSISLYKVKEVESFLQDHPKGFDFKQGHELLAGCVLAKICMTNEELDVGVGFRLAETHSPESSNRPPLDKLLSDYSIDDRDIDIIIGNDDWQSALQITRLDERGKGSTPHQRLKTLLDKKMLVQPDPKLHLVILIDETFELKYEEIRNYISTKPVSYGKICLIGQTGDTPKLGRFQCIELYPNLCTYNEIEICLTN